MTTSDNQPALRETSLKRLQANSVLRSDENGIITLSFLLLPEYAMISLLSAIEPLRVANRLAGKTLYRWQCLSENGQPVFASNDMALQHHHAMIEVETPRNLFVVSSFNPQKHINQPTINWLRQLNRQGCLLGSFDTGCYLLAAADLLDDHPVALHWEAIPAFEETYPRLKVSPDLFKISANRITCAGGTAVLDLIFELLQQNDNSSLASSVCDQFIKGAIRQKSDKQRLNLAHSLNIYNPRLLSVLALMESQIDNPISLNQLAKMSFVSLRQLERLFHQFLDCSPSHYYLKLRLHRARQLLCESSLSTPEIAAASGFNSTSHFGRVYRKHFGITPGVQRRVK